MKEFYRFTIETESERDGIPAIVSLKRWLKAGLRQFNLRCIRVNRVDAADGTEPLEGSGDDE